jgi:hypothetical protein
MLRLMHSLPSPKMKKLYLQDDNEGMVGGGGGGCHFLAPHVRSRAIGQPNPQIVIA